MNNAALNNLSDAVLDTIRRHPSSRFSIEKLSRRHKSKKAEVVAAVELLRQTGYGIEIDDKGEIKFLSAPDLLLAPEIAFRLRTKLIGRTIYAYKSVQSTNLLAAQLAEAHAPEGSIVVAEAQTRGRGRLGRSWHSPEGLGIYVSIILYPKIDPVTAPGLSIMTAISLAETIDRYNPGSVQIKWPNDCLINGRKVAGILTALSAEVGHVNHVVVGIGVNINHRRQDFPAEMTRSATSLRAELKHEIGRVEFLRLFLAGFEKDYRRFIKSGLKAHRRKILKYSNLIGKRIRLDMSGQLVAGRAIDIDNNGSLVLETPEGRRSFNAGEVTVIKNR